MTNIRKTIHRASFQVHLLAIALLSVLLVSTSVAQTLSEQLLPLLENPGNPLLEISSSEGDLYLELFPNAAPQSVRRVLDLATGTLMPNGNGGNYYDGLTFHRVVPGSFLQTGAAERAGRERPRTMADEINARGLGLEQQKLLDNTGRPHAWMNIADTADFQDRVLVPLYRNMNIRSREQADTQQDRITDRLRNMNIMQAHELLGYRYNAALPSRRPVAGSVLMANKGPGTNDAELLISLIDTPWLTATHTVIGRIVAGGSLANSISRQPESSVRIYHIRPVEILLTDVVQQPVPEGVINESNQP
ncbi:MAG: peptidylprolyl isomerase [Pseudohongiella sp.]|nr:peptidylprolyl isomerase [Pseudohongiella sp.]